MMSVLNLIDGLNIVSGLCAQRLMVNYQNGGPVYKPIVAEIFSNENQDSCLEVPTDG